MGFSTWWKNKVSDFIDDDLLGTASNLCRYRGGDRHCRYPHTLNAEASVTERHLVWNIVDRGFCPREHWDRQLFCPLSLKGPNVGDDPAPLPYNQGGQRTPLPPSRRLQEIPIGQDRWVAVQVRGTVQAATAVDVHRVVLADGTIVDSSEVLYPVYHPTEGLSD